MSRGSQVAVVAAAAADGLLWPLTPSLYSIAQMKLVPHTNTCQQLSQCIIVFASFHAKFLSLAAGKIQYQFFVTASCYWLLGKHAKANTVRRRHADATQSTCLQACHRLVGALAIIKFGWVQEH